MDITKIEGSVHPGWFGLIHNESDRPPSKLNEFIHLSHTHTHTKVSIKVTKHQSYNLINTSYIVDKLNTKTHPCWKKSEKPIGNH